MKFRTIINLNGKNHTGIRVPEEVVASLGSSKKPPVKVTIGDYTYRSTVATMGGHFMIPVSAEHRSGANLADGDEVDVDIVLDVEPRVVDLPSDFADALGNDSAARLFFEGLSYSNKRRIVIPIEGAKTEETRQRRIDKAVSMLREGRI